MWVDTVSWYLKVEIAVGVLGVISIDIGDVGDDIYFLLYIFIKILLNTSNMMFHFCGPVYLKISVSLILKIRELGKVEKLVMEWTGKGKGVGKEAKGVREYNDRSRILIQWGTNKDKVYKFR